MTKEQQKKQKKQTNKKQKPTPIVQEQKPTPIVQEDSDQLILTGLQKMNKTKPIQRPSNFLQRPNRQQPLVRVQNVPTAQTINQATTHSTLVSKQSDQFDISMVSVEVEQEKPKKQQINTLKIQTQKQQEKKEQKIGLHEDPDLKSKKYRINIIPTQTMKQNQNANHTFSKKKISIMSWNVWNQGQIQPSNIQSRYSQIIKIIKSKSPDILCLQQTQAFWEKYLQSFLRIDGTQYYYSRPSFNSTVILCKAPAKFYQIKFSKGLRTKPMSVCEFQIQCSDKINRSVVVHSIHLKSRIDKTSSIRAFQLSAIQKINKKFDMAIMAGDFNFDDDHPQNRLVKYKYLDLQVHKVNPSEEQSLPQNQPRDLQTGFDGEELGQNQSEQNDGDEINSEFESQDSFGGYSDEWYDDQGRQYQSSSQGEEDFGQGYQEEQEYYNQNYNGYNRQNYNSFSQNWPNQYNQNQYYHENGRIANRHSNNFYHNRNQGYQNYQQAYQARRQFRFSRPNSRSNHNERRPRQNRNRLPPYHQIPDDQSANTWTYMYYPKGAAYNFDRILFNSSQFTKKIFKHKINVTSFQRLGNYSIGRYRNQKFMSYLFDKVVRSPSDHLGVYAQMWLNF